MAIKKHSKKIRFGGLSDSASQAAILMNLTHDVPERKGAFDLFTYHGRFQQQSDALPQRGDVLYFVLLSTEPSFHSGSVLQRPDADGVWYVCNLSS